GAALIASFFAFLGAGLVMPQLTLWIGRAAMPVLRRTFHLLGFLAADNIVKFPQRTALTVIALAGALAMMVSSSSIVRGIKVRSSDWMEDAFPFDVTVSATDYSATLYADVVLPPDVPALLESNPDVDSAYGVRSRIHPFGRYDVMVYAVDLDRYARLQEQRGRTGFVPRGSLPELTAGRGCITSYNFLRLHGKKEGDSIVLETPQGPQSFRILGGYEDYAWPQGTLYIHRGFYKERWGDPALSYLDVKLKKGVDREKWRRAMETDLRKSQWLFVYDVAMLKKLADDVMDNTLQLLNVQVALAIVIGFFGIV